MQKFLLLCLCSWFLTGHAQPTITNVTPGYGGAGTIIYISGTNLWETSQVTVGGIPVQHIFNAYFGSLAVVLSPGTTGTVTITVTTPAGTASSPGFQFYNLHVPEITSVTPINPVGGDLVTIKGINFNDVNKVAFNHGSVSFNLVDTNTITAVYPGGLLNSVYVATLVDTANYSSGVAPVISGFSPTSATTGTLVTITGSNMQYASGVLFGRVPASSFMLVDANTVRAVVGDGETGNIVVNGTSQRPANFGSGSAPGFTFTAAQAPIVAPSGSNPVSGPVNQIITQDGAVQTYNGSPYLQKHYDIEPQNNPSTSTATITLYFLQEDFDNFNKQAGHGPDLPTGPTDNANKANLRIFQYHGTSLYGVPGSYSGGTSTVIDPDDDKIVWNASTKNWEVSFDVSGFSGFFAASANSALPVMLVSFNAQLKGNSALLTWATSAETNFDHFELEKSLDGVSFHTIGSIASVATAQSNERNYQFADNNLQAGKCFYRLKMVDKDGRYEFSKIVVLQVADNGLATALSLHPNPAREIVAVTYPRKSTGSTLLLFDITGRAIVARGLTANSSEVKLNLSQLPTGHYILRWSNGRENLQQRLEVRK